MKSGDSLHGRYTLADRIGRGAQGETWVASDGQTGNDVVLKIFDLGKSTDWKEFDRFEAEARVLRSIDHPNIPDYVDQFEWTGGETTSFVLVQEHIDGVNLEQRVRDGVRQTMSEIGEIAASLLETIGYLQSLSPPVVHRDINPKNIIIDDRGIPFLVDFGGVQDLFGSSGTTVIGTPGYVPIEQFSGRATHRSDLYGFAATVLFLLTHRNPADLPTTDLRIDVRGACPTISPELEYVLTNYLDPVETRRTLPVRDAVALLKHERSLESLDSPVEAGAPGGVSRGASDAPARLEIPPVPAGSKIRHEVLASGEERVFIPASGIRGTNLILLPFALFWTGFVAFWTVGAATMGAPVLFSLFSVPFWAVGIGMLAKVGSSALKRTEIRVVPANGGPERFVLTRKVGPVTRTIDLPTSELGLPSIDTANTRNGRPESSCTFEIGVKRIRLGASLSAREQRWLCSFVERHAGPQ